MITSKYCTSYDQYPCGQQPEKFSFYTQMGISAKGNFTPPATVSLGGKAYITEDVNQKIATVIHRATAGQSNHCLLHASNSYSLQTFNKNDDAAGWLLSANELKERGKTINSGEQSNGQCVDEDCVFTFPHDTAHSDSPDISCFDERCLPRYANYGLTASSEAFPVIYIIDPKGCTIGETNNLFGSVLPEVPVVQGISPTQIQGIMVPLERVESVRECLKVGGYGWIIITSWESSHIF